jgi:membrane protease YdiL (CAAX protease family)
LLPDDGSAPSAPATAAPDRFTALIEVLLCSGFPTQALVVGVLAAAGQRPTGSLTLSYVVAVSLIDSVVLVALIAAFIHLRGERVPDVFLGNRRVLREAAAGVPLIFVALAIGIGVLTLVQVLAPALHDVEQNPLQSLIATPRDAAVFALVVVIAGGIREELQRAFLLRRFERQLGGPVVGVIVASAVFGAGHRVQGADAAIATAVLGAFWAVTYLRRRSVVAPVISHSGFNLLQLLQFTLS